MSVSVIIPCFNAARFIGETIRSVLAQDDSPLEVIVVDDHSTDGSPDLVERAFPGVRLVESTGHGASAARNLGTQLATGDYLQYLDADDVLAAGKLRTQRMALEQSGADVAYGDWQRLIGGGEEYRPGELVTRNLHDPEIDLFSSQWSPPAVYLFRRSIVERVGGWREDLPIIQDARFVLDCALHGGRFVRCDGIMALYRTHEHGSLSTSRPRAFVHDVFRNALQVEELWRARGDLTHPEADALRQSYEYVARASFATDRATFDDAYAALLRVCPGYLPSGPRHLRVASALLGYARAEQAALWYRQMKSRVARIAPSVRSP